MTSKTVLVKVPNGRNFKVFFSANDNQTDFSAFKESFYKICEKDCDLNILVLNNEYNRFSFRKYDDTFKCMVELTDFEEIPNGAIIELFIFLSVFADIPVKSEETARNLPLDTFSNDDSSCSFNDMNIFLNDTSENNDSINEIMNTTIHNNLSQQSSKFKTSRLVYPCALPEFSPVVKYAIQNGTIQHSYARFVRESAAFLLTMVEQPTRPDYEIFCRTLAEKYDFINVKNIPGIVAPYAVFKKHLSQSVRNARYYSNKKMKSNHTSSDNTEIEGNKVSENTEKEMEGHNKEIIRSLRKKERDSVHIAELMRITANYRREKILSSHLKIAELQSLYPALKFQEWIIFDFSYATGTTVEDREMAFRRGMTSLKNMKKDNSNDGLSDFHLLKWLEKKLASTKCEGSCIKELASGDHAITSDIDAPYVVISTGKNGQIGDSVILAEGNIICRINSVNLFVIFDTLLAVYFIFNYKYPSPYSNFLTFLQILLIQKPVTRPKMTSALVKFMKEYEKYQ